MEKQDSDIQDTQSKGLSYLSPLEGIAIGQFMLYIDEYSKVSLICGNPFPLYYSSNHRITESQNIFLYWGAQNCKHDFFRSKDKKET